MYKIAICDDDEKYRKRVREIIKMEGMIPLDEIRFFEYRTGRALLEQEDIIYDLIFLDIRMPGLDGNKTALKLRENNKEATLVFCSSYFEMTPDSINIGRPFRYIMKDLYDNGLKKEMASILSNVMKCNKEHILIITSGGNIMRVYTMDILYICLVKRGCCIYIIKSDTVDMIRCRESLNDLYNKLATQGFEYAHNSYIVNMGNVEGLKKNVLHLKKGIQLNVSRSKKARLADALLNYFQERNGVE